MHDRGCGLRERRSVVAAAAESLAGFGECLHEASGAELAELMAEADRVAARAAALRVAVTVEAVRRGEVAGSGMSVHAWVREHATSLRQGGAGHVAKVAVEVAGASGSAGSLVPDAGGADGGVPDPGSPLGMVWAGVRDASVSPALAVATLGEVARLEPLLTEAAVPTVTSALLELGTAWGPTVMRRLRPRLLAEHGRVGVLDDLQHRLGSVARLSAPHVESGDVTEYQLVMTPEQAAALEAAIGPLSAPCPNEETGERDLRPAGQRRVEALTQVCRRSSAVDADGHGSDGPASSDAAVHVSISLADLQARTGIGEVLGSTATGTILSPEVLRRLACDAALIPHVLGSAGEHLDLGRVVRLFTRAQRRRLWHRDRGCTYPGCTAPAGWARAHHVRHWADGGPSDVDNAALLCQRHHTLVHRRRLWAQVRQHPDEQGRYVIWDLHDGGYDRHLEALQRERAAHDPPALTPQRFAELLAAITGEDVDDRRWAALELDEHQAPGPDEDWLGEPWMDGSPSACVPA
jgi:hypothetical protein